MAQNDFVWASVPLPTDLPVRNYGTTDIPAFSVVKLDTGNLVSGTNESIGVAICGTADRPLGVTIDDLPSTSATYSKQGRMRTVGWVPVSADSAITAQTLCRAGFNGMVTSELAGTSASIGQALQTAAAFGDVIMIQIQLSF